MNNRAIERICAIYQFKATAGDATRAAPPAKSGIAMLIGLICLSRSVSCGNEKFSFTIVLMNMVTDSIAGSANQGKLKGSAKHSGFSCTNCVKD